MSKLAINGGNKVFSEPPVIPAWPPIYPETGKQLEELYLNRKWSFYGAQELLFNQKFAEYTGAKHSVLMVNGTVTLEMALKAMDIGPGDEVIVPAFTWLGSGEAVAYRGAIPVIVDIEPDTLCMDPAAFEAAITPRTKAVMPVHLFGSMADMEKIMKIARKHNLRVLEDCAHSHGGCWDGKHTGTIGDVGSFSFQQSKVMASGEGGCCITNDDKLHETLGQLSHIGYQLGAKQGEAGAPPPMGMLCHNYRITDFQALILLSQLARLKEDTLLRSENAEYLRKRLNAIPGIRVQAPGRLATMQSYYMFTMMVDHTRLKPGITRKEVLTALGAEGVGVFVAWGEPMYKQRLWTVAEKDYRIESCKNAETIVRNEMMMSSLMWLMTSHDVLDKYCQAFEKVMAEYYC